MDSLFGSKVASLLGSARPAVKADWGPSFRSPSGKRMHPRVRLPAAAVIDGQAYPLRDLGLGGFALEGAGPAARAGMPFLIELRVGQAELRLTIETTARVIRVAEDGGAEAFQFIDLTPEASAALDRLVELWLGGDGSLADAVPRVQPTTLSPAPAPARGSWNPRHLRAAALLAGGILAVVLGGGYVISRRLVVYSEFGAVAAPLRLIRAPRPGVVTLQEAALGTLVEPGQPLAQILPTLPPQVSADLEPGIQQLEGRARQLDGELAQVEAGFRAFRTQAEQDHAVAVETRRLAERQVQAQERLFRRFAELSRQGYVAAARADQEEVNLMVQRRSLSQAIAEENAARNLLEEARAGRYRADGRPAARSPEEIRREAQAVEGALAETRATLARLAEPVPLVSPCLCRIAQIGVTSGTVLGAGEAIFGLAEPSRSSEVEVDALVPSARMPFLRVGQEVGVHLGGAAAPTRGRIAAMNYNPENTGRVGLPDNLRTLHSYGLVTVTLAEAPEGTATGLPALVEAPIHLRMLLLNLPGFGWLTRLGG